jgi:hypothetical protein
LGYFPFARKLANVGFGLFVDVERAEVPGTCGLVEADVGGGAMFPVFDEGAQVLDPFLAAVGVGSLVCQKYFGIREGARGRGARCVELQDIGKDVSRKAHPKGP